MNSFLTWVAGVLAVVLAALFAVPYFVDWNGYRGVFEEEASRILGRNVRVRGDVNLRLLPSPYVRFEKLRIADSTGLTGEPLFFAESFTMWLAVSPMLKGIIEAERIELDQPVLRLAMAQDGQANWNGLSFQAGSLPFVPAGIALQSVHVVDGVLSVDIEGGGRLGEVRQINGELTASELAGPYSFSGTTRHGRAKYNVNVGVGARDARGDMRVKVRAQVPRTPDVYKFVGDVTGLDKKPKITGVFNASLVLGAERLKSGTDVEVATTVSADARGAQAKNVSITFESSGQPQTISGDALTTWDTRSPAVVSLSSQWLDLDHFSPRKGVAAKPAEASTGATPDADAGGGQRVTVDTPLKTVRYLLGGIDGYMPEGIEVEARIKLDQAKLGGDSLSNVQLVLKRSGQNLDIESLTARLPGSGRLEFSGSIKPAETGIKFAGDVFVGGPSLARVKAWAIDGGERRGVISDGPFSIDGRLVLGPNVVAIQNARAEFSGVPVNGSVVWKGDADTGDVAIDLDGYELDSRWVGIKAVELGRLVRAAGGGAGALNRVLFGSVDQENSSEAQATETRAQGGEDSSALGSRNISVKLKAGRLINGDEIIRDVDADISVEYGKLSIRAISFETSEGLGVTLEGDVAGVDKRPRGELRFVVSARDARAVQALGPLIEVGSTEAGGAVELLGKAVPFRLAGKLNLGERAEGAADVELDGVVRGGRLVGQLLFDGGLDAWRDRRADVTLSVKSEASREVLNLLGIANGRGVGARQDDVPMRAVFKAVGVPSSSMKAMGLAKSSRLTLVYNGSVGVEKKVGAPVRFNAGEVVVAAMDSREVLDLIGIPVGEGVERARADGFIDFVRDGDTVVFHPRDLKLGQSTVAGRVAFLSDESGERSIDADLVVDKVELGSMMSVFLGRSLLHEVIGVGEEATAGGEPRATAAGAPKPELARANRKAAKVARGGGAKTGSGEEGPVLAAGVRRIENVFSESPFDLSGLAHLRGRVGLKVGRFALGQGVEVANAEFENVFGREKIDVTLASGSALGGTASGQLTFEKGRAGVGLTGGFKLENASLEKLAAWDETGVPVPFAVGRSTIKAAFAGRALSPRGLVSVLSGKGEIVLKNAVVKGLSPEIVTRAADEIMAREVSQDKAGRRGSRSKRREENNETSAEVASAIKEHLSLGELELGTRTIPIDIVDGAARLTPFSMKNKHGVTTSKITFDIGQLAVDGDFRLVNRGVEGKAPWPEVSVVYVGPAGQIGALRPLIGAAALEREVMVRKLEQSVAELERLRRVDEEAAKRRLERAAERQRELEAARALAAEEAEANDPAVVVPSAENGAPGSVGPDGKPLAADAAAGSVQATEPGFDELNDPSLRAEAEREKALRARRARRAQRKAAAKAAAKKKRPAASNKSANDIFLQQF